MQSSKLQTIRKLFVPQDRRAQAPWPDAHDAPLAVPRPIRTRSNGSDPDSDVTPTASYRGPFQRRSSTDSFYSQRGFSQSQPDVRGVAAPQLRHSPPLPSVPTRGPQPQMKPEVLSDDVLMAAERLDNPGRLPLLGRHRRDDSGLESADGSIVYVADHSSNATTTSGFLSRGASTASTGISDGRIEAKHPSLEACGVQQDFCLSAMNLRPEQRMQLLVSVPQRIFETYEALYARDLELVDFWAGGGWPGAGLWGAANVLHQERDAARMCPGIGRGAQDGLIKACAEVLRTPGGDKRLCRFLRWLLQADVNEQRSMPAHDLMVIASLSAQEVRDLLEPLQLDPSQQARLNKHCRTVPQRYASRSGFGSSFSYRYP